MINVWFLRGRIVYKSVQWRRKEQVLEQYVVAEQRTEGGAHRQAYDMIQKHQEDNNMEEVLGPLRDLLFISWAVDLF